MSDFLKWSKYRSEHQNSQSREAFAAGQRHYPPEVQAVLEAADRVLIEQHKLELGTAHLADIAMQDLAQAFKALKEK